MKVSSLILLIFASTWPAAVGLVEVEKVRNWGITEQTIARSLTPSVYAKTLPEQLSLPGFTGSEQLQVNYTINTELQAEAQRLLKRHNPDYGIFVAIDPDTGYVLAMAESTRDGHNHGNLALMNSFPAASISKIITAAAAVNENKANGSTVIPFNGKSTSLYKKNVFNHKKNKWTRNVTLDNAFAKSVNTVFGRLGAVHLGGDMMLEYAYRMGFNGRFASDFTFDNGRIDLDPEDQWQVAESAAGYTRRNTLSPLHGATLGAIAINGGNLVAPVLVESLVGPYGIPIYVHEESSVSPVIDEASAKQLKNMMKTTVRAGSARTSFRGFHKGSTQDVEVGGKTGSLTGFKPKGKYDWFVGFGQRGEQKIAYAVLCINKEKWYVKSTRFAREIMKFYFTDVATKADATS